MRVTRAIREFVEEEIRKKYDAAAAEIGKDYEAEKQKVMDVVTKIMHKAEGEALEYLKLVGFEPSHYYRSDHLFNISGSVTKKGVEDKLFKERQELRNKCEKKIKQVLFDLEMGETEKAELKEVLDAITVE